MDSNNAVVLFKEVVLFSLYFNCRREILRPKVVSIVERSVTLCLYLRGSTVLALLLNGW